MIHIVGAGRIGQALHTMAVTQGCAGVLVRRGEPLPKSPGPVVVCTRNDDVQAVIDAAPDPKALVFVQNGALLPWLRERGLGQNTQGLLYFAVPLVGAPPDPGAPSVFFGPHAAELVSLLESGGLPARELASAGELTSEIAVKLLWAAIFGLLGDLNQETVLASAARRDEVEAFVAELLPVCAAGLGATMPKVTAVTARIVSYSVHLGSWRASVKEWRWRNGWLAAEAHRTGVALPLHAAACARVAALYSQPWAS